MPLARVYFFFLYLLKNLQQQHSGLKLDGHYGETFFCFHYLYRLDVTRYRSICQLFICLIRLLHFIFSAGGGGGTPTPDRRRNSLRGAFASMLNIWQMNTPRCVHLHANEERSRHTNIFLALLGSLEASRSSCNSDYADFNSPRHYTRLQPDL